MNILASSFLALTLTLVSAGTVSADSCQPGTFPSTISEHCLPPHPREDPDAFDKPMSFTMRQVGIRAELTWIAAEGIITQDTPNELRRLLEEQIVYRENRIEFNSPGGNLYAAMELGRIIRGLGNPTTLGRSLTLDNPDFSMDVISFPDAVCFSACAYAFLGGQQRYFFDTDRLGVHRFGNADYQLSADEAQGATSDVARYLEEMGVDQRLLQIASRTAFEDNIFIIDAELASDLRVAFDPNNRSSRFEISLLNSNIVANTSIFHQGFEYSARLHCIDRTPKLVVWGPRDRIPSIFHDLNNAVAKFHSGEFEFNVLADGGTLQNGNAYVTFSGFDLALALMANGTIQLDMVWARAKDWDSMETWDRFEWADMALWFGFSLTVENAESTLPIVLRECG